MSKIKSLEELTTADERSLRFTPWGFSTAGKLDPKIAANYLQEMISHCEMVDEVPDNIRNSFERLRMLHSYGILTYEAFTIAEDLAWLLLEQALRERFITFYDSRLVSFDFVGVSVHFCEIGLTGQSPCLRGLGPNHRDLNLLLYGPAYFRRTSIRPPDGDRAPKFTDCRSRGETDRETSLQVVHRSPIAAISERFVFWWKEATPYGCYLFFRHSLV